MAGALRQYYKYKVQVQVVLNYGLVYILDRDLQKQLDDLNEMKKMNYNIFEQFKKRFKVEQVLGYES